MVAYEWRTSENNTIIPYLVPGAVAGCFVIDSLLFSTLECFHMNSCLSMYYKQIDKTITMQSKNITWFYPKPLVYDEASSHFPLNDSLSVIVKEMMVEQWNSSYSFKHYYEVCAPSYCTYSDMTRTNSFIGVLIKLISTVAGLIAALRLITPQLVKMVLSLFKSRTRIQVQGKSLIECLT